MISKMELIEKIVKRKANAIASDNKTAVAEANHYLDLMGVETFTTKYGIEWRISPSAMESKQ